MREHETVVLRDRLEHRRESRIVETEPLHVLVHLQPRAARAQRVAHVAGGIGVIEVNRAQRHRAAAEFAGGRGEPVVQFAGDPRLVRIGAERERLDPVLAQDAGDGVRFGRVFEHPRAALREPAPDRSEQPRRVQVRVNVDHGEPALIDANTPSTG